MGPALFGWITRGPALHSPRWLQAAVYALLATAAVCWPVWPGYMSFDSLIAYDETFTGVWSMNWPPTHTYLFWISRHLGAQAWGVFLLQTFVLFLCAGAILSVLSRSRLLAVLAQAGFAALFLVFPTLLGTVVAQWRDVTTAACALLAVALWLEGARTGRAGWLVGAAAAVGFAVSLRYNAAPLFVLIAPLMVIRPYLGRRAPHAVRALVLVALVLFIGLGWASTRWRLPDLHRPDPIDPFAAIQLFDLVGVSACSGTNYLPISMTEGRRITVAQIRQLYDPRNVLRILDTPPPGVPRLYDRNLPPIKEAWPRVVRAEPGCYLAHRGAVLAELMGVVKGEVYYPTHGVIDPNRFGFRLARPAEAAKLNRYVAEKTPELWRRPAVLFAVALAAVALAIAVQQGAAGLLVALLAGAYAYPGLLTFIAPAADARYIFPATTICALLTCAGVAVALGGRQAAASSR